MLPERVSNPGPLTYESGALPITLRDPVAQWVKSWPSDLADRVRSSLEVKSTQP